jgi:ABC-2 type transport system ATP-binding protein
MTSTLEPEARQSSNPLPQYARPRRALWNEGPIIKMEGAGKNFGKDKIVVHDLNFEVTPGQIFCLLGPSGSGKSTTMRMLTGLYKPSEGKVTVFGREPHKFRKKWRERIGYMPQQFVLFPEISTLGNVNFVASVYGMGWFNRGPKIKRALEFVDLWDARNRLASQLSGGMQRRLELAATLVHNPELIFVDEPTAGIDPILRSKFWDHFRELRDQGRTIFVTTQYVTEADYCDKVAILNRGRILALGEPSQIRRDAFGGDIVNLSLEFVSPQAIEIIRRVPGVTYVQFLNTQDLKLTVNEGGETVPYIISALQEGNIAVKSIEQYRPDFEEVFVRLMEQDEVEDDEEEEVATERPKKKKNQHKEEPVPVQVAPPSPPPAAPVIVQPQGNSAGNGRREEFVRPQVAIQPDNPNRARDKRSSQFLQPQSMVAGGGTESPVPPGGPNEPFPPTPGPLPGPELPGGPDNPPWPVGPGQPGQSVRPPSGQATPPQPGQPQPGPQGTRPVVGSNNYQPPKGPVVPPASDGNDADTTMKLPAVSPNSNSTGENNNPGNQEAGK